MIFLWIEFLKLTPPLATVHCIHSTSTFQECSCLLSATKIHFCNKPVLLNNLPKEIKVVHTLFPTLGYIFFRRIGQFYNFFLGSQSQRWVHIFLRHRSIVAFFIIRQTDQWVEDLFLMDRKELKFISSELLSINFHLVILKCIQ